MRRRAGNIAAIEQGALFNTRIVTRLHRLIGIIIRPAHKSIRRALWAIAIVNNDGEAHALSLPRRFGQSFSGILAQPALGA